VKEGKFADQPLDHDLLAAAVDHLGRVAGSTVMLVVFRDTDGECYMAPHPSYGEAIFEYMKTVDWDRAIADAQVFGP
jgi:hypothetical protein